jgi:hypothetical protein
MGIVRDEMSIKDATSAIAQYIRDTGKPLSEAIKLVWPDLGPFSKEEKQTLMMEALASRVNPILNNPVNPRWGNGEVEVGVTSYRQPAMERHEVTCQILQDVIYHVNGAAKPIAVFTKYDVLTKLESVRNVEAGVVRHRKMWEYIHERLTALNKSKVEDLAEGEQTKIARMIFDLRQQKESKDLLELS